ncbi:sulfite exporter TauE/SafE family protein [Hyphomonas sp.]|uniref:sulfite exporter TauE/SafE family protein n=1 Tax=Hyphomonas sp. TaxID=87 RepID=UPI0030F67968
MPILLAILFFITAGFYAAVGFGGGSTYNALLVLNGTDYRILPSIALCCNIIVVTGGVIRFWQAGHLRIARLVPFLAASIPAAWLGGRLPVSETMFIGLLGGALLLSGLHLVFQSAPEALSDQEENKASAIIGLAVGGSIGLVSGLVGIGGGIFLAPILYMLKWGPPRQIAAACSLFILANSFSGLTGQIMKLQDTDVLSLVLPYWPLLPAVLVGGQIGSWFAAQGLQPKWIKRLTAVLILYVACRLILRWVSLAGLVG